MSESPEVPEVPAPTDGDEEAAAVAAGVRVRPISEDDVDAVIGIYRAVYGDSFPFQEFYDARWIKKGVFDDDVVWLVAERDAAGEPQIVGSAAVMLGAGDRDDGIGEVGRLVVLPEARGLDVGTRLIEGLQERVEPIVQCAFGECRTRHTGAQKILTRLGFTMVGIEPLAYQLGEVRESMVFVTRLFGHARELRRNHPRVIPSAHELASIALRGCGLEADAVVETHADPYPVFVAAPTEDDDGVARPAAGAADEPEVRALERGESWRLLLLSRGERQDPEVFGALRLEHGFLRLTAHSSSYLGLYRGETLLGGLGYSFDDLDSKVRIFDIVAADDRSRGSIMERGLRWIERRHDPAYLSIDVSAHAPRMQRTLELLGFAPVAYCPSMVFGVAERLDVIRMVKLRVPPRLDDLELIPAAQRLFEVVHERLVDQARGVEIDDVARRVRLFQGLSDLQIGELCTHAHELLYDEGDWVFAQGAGEQSLFVVLEGAVDIVLGDGELPIPPIEAGEVFGEMALVEGLPRSAGARCRMPSRLLVIRPEDFRLAARRDPSLGNVVHRNLARTLSARLRGLHDEVDALRQDRDGLLDAIRETCTETVPDPDAAPADDPEA